MLSDLLFQQTIRQVIVYSLKTDMSWTSLVVQWLRIHLPVFPSWLCGKKQQQKNPTYQCRRHRFNPWSGKISYALGQLILGATTTEPTQLKFQHSTACALQQEKTSQEEACTPQQGSSLHSPQLQKANTEQQRPSTPKNKQIKQTWTGTSLVVQRLTPCSQCRELGVRSLVRELDPTCAN